MKHVPGSLQVSLLHLIMVFITPFCKGVHGGQQFFLTTTLQGRLWQEIMLDLSLPTELC